MLRITVILFAFLISGGAYAQSQPPSPLPGEGGHSQSQTKKSQKQSTQNQRDTELPPIIVQISPSQKSETETAEDTKERQEKAKLDRELVDFNRDLAYYTKILAWVAGLQFLALIGQMVFLRLAFKESRRATDIARDAMVAGERAFVFATDILHLWERDSSTGLYNWRFRPAWQNSGDTPTKNMTMHTECVLRDANTPLPPGFNFDYSTSDIGKAFIAPKITSYGGLAPRFPAAAISPQDILDIQAGRKILYIWGWARYSDIFANTPPHITRFCWTISPVGDPMTYKPGSQINQVGSLTFSTIHHTEGNCADEECTP